MLVSCGHVKTTSIGSGNTSAPARISGRATLENMVPTEHAQGFGQSAEPCSALADSWSSTGMHLHSQVESSTLLQKDGVPWRVRPTSLGADVECPRVSRTMQQSSNVDRPVFCKCERIFEQQFGLLVLGAEIRTVGLDRTAFGAETRRAGAVSRET